MNANIRSRGLRPLFLTVMSNKVGRHMESDASYRAVLSRPPMLGVTRQITALALRLPPQTRPSSHVHHVRLPFPVTLDVAPGSSRDRRGIRNLDVLRAKGKPPEAPAYIVSDEASRPRR